MTNKSELRQLCWNGIPDEHRAEAWQILVGYIPLERARRQETLGRKRKDYASIALSTSWDSSAKSDEGTYILNQIQKDILRTAGDLPLFQDKRIQLRLERLLYTWACRHPAISYVQGMNDIVVPFFIVFLQSHCVERQIYFTVEVLEKVEADCFWCLSKLISSIQDHYTPGQHGVQRMLSRLENLIGVVNYELSQHIKNNGIDVIHFSFSWMNCLLVQELPHRCVMRLFDTYLSEENGFGDFHVYVCAAFLNGFSSKIMALDHDGLMEFLTHIPMEEISPSRVEVMLSQAYVWYELYKESKAHLLCSRQTKTKTKTSVEHMKRNYSCFPPYLMKLYKNIMLPEKVRAEGDSSATTVSEI